MAQKNATHPTLSNKQVVDAAKALEVLFTTHYISKKRLYWENFKRGLFFSMGTIIGAMLIITLLLWILSLTKDVPFLGPISQNAHNTVQEQSTK